MLVVVTGCCGLIGSHVAEALLARGDRVIGVDNLSTGSRSNLETLEHLPGFEFVEGDICSVSTWDAIDAADAVMQFACPASPIDFAPMGPEILRAGSVGTLNAVEWAADHGARYLHASSSEVYGEPHIHPQQESYRGNVSTIGERACYDESKRFSEAIISTYMLSRGLDGAIARIFNTYGPRMRADDGRVISNFVVAALTGADLTVYGDGQQTRSFCHVDDQARGLLALLDSGESGPFNLGNPQETTVLEVAKIAIELTGSTSAIDYGPLPPYDPTRRRPDITAARSALGWEPSIDLSDGMSTVIDYFAEHI